MLTPIDLPMVIGQMAMETVRRHFPCRKLRRSHRLEIKEQTDAICQTIQDGPLGFFEILPLEVKFITFAYLPVEDLSLLTITSKAMRNIVELYKNTACAQSFLLPRPVSHAHVAPEQQHDYYRDFEKLGILTKRSTCLYTTKDRLKIVQQFLYKYLCSFHKDCEEPTKCIALSCYGKFLNTVISGWDDKECTRTFEVIGQNTLMLKNLHTIVSGKPGAFPSMELHVRLFLRRVFLEYCNGKSEKAFWLNLILRPFPMVQQARILLLVYGPLYGAEVQWFEMCETTPVNKDHAKLYFSDMAGAFRALSFYGGKWSEDAIISVFDELTSFPEEWLSENTANLLYLCGDVITLKVLSSKAINGRLAELANLISSLCLVCWRHGQSLSWVTDIIHDLCTVFDHPRSKVTFLDCVVDTFKEVIVDLHEFGDSDDDGTQDFHNIVDAQAEFIKEIMGLAFHDALKS